MLSEKLVLQRFFLIRLIAFTAISLFSSLTLHAHEKCTAVHEDAVTRESVVADLMRWQLAGMDKYEYLYVSYGLESKEYMQAKDKYLTLTAASQVQCNKLKTHEENGRVNN